jgi:hypothetical protein
MSLVDQRAVQGPSQTRTVRDGGVDVGNVRNPTFNQRICFAPRRRLKPVGYVTGNLAAHQDRPFAHRKVEEHRGVDVHRVGEPPWDHFHERDQVHGVEGMPDQDSVGVIDGHPLQLRGPQARRTAGDGHASGGCRIELTNKLTLQVSSLRSLSCTNCASATAEPRSSTNRSRSVAAG